MTCAGEELRNRDLCWSLIESFKQVSTMILKRVRNLTYVQTHDLHSTPPIQPLMFNIQQWTPKVGAKLGHLSQEIWNQ